jgi:hypothetical protein
MSLINSGYINAPIWGEILVSPSGFPFNDATYSMIIGERKMANIIQKGRNRKDHIKRPVFDMMDTEVDVELYENDLQTFYNWMLMSKMGLSNWQFIGPDGKYWNYVENVGNNIGAPVGTWLLGTLPSFEIGDVERSIKIKAQGGGYRREWRLLNQSGSIAYPGGVSGSAISGFAHTHYDMGAVGAPGLVAVTCGGENIPFMTTGSKFSLEAQSFPSPTSPRHQPLLVGFNVKVEIETQFSDLAQTQDALESYVNSDKVWQLDFAPTENDIVAARGNLKVVLHDCTFIDPGEDMKETASFTTKINMEGFVPLDSPAWAGNNILVNIATNTITLNRVGLT